MGSVVTPKNTWVPGQPSGGGGSSSSFVAPAFAQGPAGQPYGAAPPWDPRRRNPYGRGGFSNAQMGYSGWMDQFGLNAMLADLARQGMANLGQAQTGALNSARAQYGADPSSYGFAATQGQIGAQNALTNALLQARAGASGQLFQHNLDKDMLRYQQQLAQPSGGDMLMGLGGQLLGGFANPLLTMGGNALGRRFGWGG